MIGIGVLREDIPFEDEAAQREADRLGVILYESVPQTAVDPRAYMHMADFLQRRNRMLACIDEQVSICDALICDADAAGHLMELGHGLCDLDSYIQHLLQKNVQNIILCGVCGTSQMERSIRLLREKIAAYHLEP